MNNTNKIVIILAIMALIWLTLLSLPKEDYNIDKDYGVNIEKAIDSGGLVLDK